jgi:nucleoside-diphosphate-sugar epimerase
MLNASTGQGRVAFISGAASPIGFGHTAAVLLARHGAKVVVTDLKSAEELGKKVVAEIKAEGGEAVWFVLGDEVGECRGLKSRRVPWLIPGTLWMLRTRNSSSMPPCRDVARIRALVGYSPSAVE